MCEAGAADGGHPCSCDPVTSGHLQHGPAVFSQASRNGSHLVEMGRATWAGKTPPRWEGGGAKVPREEPPPSGWSSSGPSSAPHTRLSLHHSRPRSRSRWLSSCSDGAKCRREASHLRERPAAEKPGAQTHDEGGEGGGQDGTVERRSVVRTWGGGGRETSSRGGPPTGWPDGQKVRTLTRVLQKQPHLVAGQLHPVSVRYPLPRTASSEWQDRAPAPSSRPICEPFLRQRPADG